MNVDSKFRKMYFIKFGIFNFIGIVLATTFISKSITSDGDINFQYAPSWIGILLLFFILIGFISNLQLCSISVNEKEIVLQYIFFNKSKTVQYTEIATTNRIKIQQMVRSGPVSDGYHATAIILKDDKQLVISPDEYENYAEIVHAIKSNWKNEV